VLESNLPPGTRLWFVRPSPQWKLFDEARLVGPVSVYFKASAEDEFRVEFGGTVLVVQRQDIKPAPPFR
jgi:hypothetical protein